MVLALTHEEIVTTHVAQVVRSYRDLPLILYHFQIKGRDEARPRAGVLRTREFIMKDSYTFDRDARGPGRRLREAPRGLRQDLRPLRAGVVPGRVRRRDDGRHRRARVHGALPGGRERRRAGARLRRQRRGRERRRRSRSSCRRRWTRRSRSPRRADDGRRRSPSALGVPAGALIKAYPIIVGDDELRLVLVRGDHRVNDIKLANALGAAVPAGARGGVRGPDRARRATSARSAPTSPILIDSRARRRRLHHRRQQGRRAPARRRAGPRLRVHARSTCARSRRGTPSTATRSGSSPRSRSATSSSSARATRCRWARPTWTRTARRSRSGWAPTASARRASRPPRSSSSPTRRASRGRARWRRSTSHLVGLGKPGTEERALAERLYDELRELGLDVIYDDRDARPGREVRRRRAARRAAAADGRPAHDRGGRDRGPGPARARDALRPARGGGAGGRGPVGDAPVEGAGGGSPGGPRS